jgi:hypothetical protein
MEIVAYHGKVVPFTGNCKGNRECTPVILPPQNPFKRKKCLPINNKPKLFEWYVDNLSQYGMLWDPSAADGIKVEIKVPHTIALPPPSSTPLPNIFMGTMMPQELLEALGSHLGGNDTSLSNGEDWGLVQKWLLVALQMDGRNGNPTRFKLHPAFQMDPILSNDNLIYRWISKRLDATLGRLPDPNSASTTIGIKGDMSVVQNMSGIIAMEVVWGLGMAIQNTTKRSTSTLQWHQGRGGCKALISG